MDKGDHAAAKSCACLASPDDPRTADTHIEDGIGFSVYYYVLNMAPNPAAKMIAIEN